MARIDGEIIIDRPVDVVFDYVADQSNEPEYNPQMVRAEKSPRARLCRYQVPLGRRVQGPDHRSDGRAALELGGHRCQGDARRGLSAGAAKKISMIYSMAGCHARGRERTS